ncbi:phage recombination protein Bet [Streptomyces lydicus]|uniref:phage recombination protein Bet n=1 Tax=Streptomyces lydicus TaxID=47763 RepID=UPI003811B41E
MANATQAPANAEGPTQHTQKTAGALAIRPDQTQWTEEQAIVLRQSGIGESVTRAELTGFLHLCQRTGLDPFSRQVYLIGRYSKKDQRDVYTPQTGIDGYRVIAQRVTAQTGGTYGYEDTVWCDASGKWRDVWLVDAPPAAAKVTVIRNGQRFSAVATFREYVQTYPDGNPKGLWAKMPAGQIAKCAEALALRKAFPHDLAGIYTAEEMAQADNPTPMPAPARPSRDFISEAQNADTAAMVRVIWGNAKHQGAPESVLNQIVAIGQEKAGAEQQSPPPSEAGADEIVEGEILNEDGAAPEPLEALMEKVSNSWKNALGMKQNLLEGKKLGVLDVMVPSKAGPVKLGDLMQNRIDQLESDSQERDAA